MSYSKVTGVLSGFSCRTSYEFTFSDNVFNYSSIINMHARIRTDVYVFFYNVPFIAKTLHEFWRNFGKGSNPVGRPLGYGFACTLYIMRFLYLQSEDYCQNLAI